MPDDGDLQEVIEETEETEHQKYGTFAGVFTPTLLTILGVIMYLRTGWVVGNAGLAWAILIILLAFVITGATALSLSSITTNIRIGAGGAYSIISQSLGVEMGGAIGIPLYLSQSLAIAMYVFGFREGWLHIFEGHPAILVDFATFGIILLISYVSAGLAFRIQYLIMAVIAASLVSVGIAFAQNPMPHEITWFGQFPGTGMGDETGSSFWAVFAVFFPATTGIMAGVNMSGDLKDPKRNIPVGTLWAVAVSLVVYVVLAFWFATAAPVEQLVSDFTLIVELSWWGPAVLAGILGATFSSALASTVGAPRILQALGDHSILPGGEWLSQLSSGGEPRNALYITAVLTTGALLLRDLNAIAPLITMFFLMTYLMINAVVCIEQGLGLVSFRPVFRVPRFVPLIGLVGCLFAMFIVNATFSLIAIGFVLALYVYLLNISLTAPYGDMRSGLFVSIAEWAVEKVSNLPSSEERTWRPNLLVPVEEAEELLGTFRIVHDLAFPKGSVSVVGLTSQDRRLEMDQHISGLREAFHKEDLFASSVVVTADRYQSGVINSMESLSGMFFRPNILFLKLPEDRMDPEREEALRAIRAKAEELDMGIVLYGRHPKSGFGRRQNVNLWVRGRSPEWDLSMELGNLDLALLLGYKLQTNWQGRLTLHTCVQESSELTAAREYMDNLTEAARMPVAETKVWYNPFDESVRQASGADLDIFGIPEEMDYGFFYEMVDQSRSSCLFVQDSGRENALA
jgi:amino acid transporter